MKKSPRKLWLKFNSGVSGKSPCSRHRLDQMWTGLNLALDVSTFFYRSLQTAPGFTNDSSRRASSRTKPLAGSAAMSRHAVVYHGIT